MANGTRRRANRRQRGLPGFPQPGPSSMEGITQVGTPSPVLENLRRRHQGLPPNQIQKLPPRPGGIPLAFQPRQTAGQPTRLPNTPNIPQPFQPGQPPVEAFSIKAPPRPGFPAPPRGNVPIPPAPSFPTAQPQPQPPGPTSPVSIPGLGAAGARTGELGFGLVQGGKETLGQGQGDITAGINQLTGAAGSQQDLLRRLQEQIGVRGVREGEELGQLGGLQQTALRPDLDPATAKQFEDAAQARRAAIEQRFQVGGGAANQFNRDLANRIADLQATGQLDATAGGTALARLTSNLGEARANQLFAADEKSREELLAERQGLRGAAGQFGGLRGDLAQQQANLTSELLGQQGTGVGRLGDIGQAIGGLGIQRGQLGTSELGAGANVLGTGLDALNQALGLGLESRGQEASLQLAQQQQREQARLSILDLKRRKKIDKQTADALLQQLEASEKAAENADSGGRFFGF